MRVLLLAALVVLTGCTVTATGAPCDGDSNCPGDQRCDGGRCTGCTSDCEVVGQAARCDGAMAALVCTQNAGSCRYLRSTACDGVMTCGFGAADACACPPAGGGVGQGCATEHLLACSADAVVQCRKDAASGCLTWGAQASCGATGLVCQVDACVCPAHAGATFAVDAIGGAALAAIPAPTGVDAPPQCRFASLHDALAAAGDHGVGATVIARGAPAAGTMTFAEPSPYEVPAGVTLTTEDAPLTTGRYLIKLENATAGKVPAVQLRPGSALKGFTVSTGTPGGSDALVALVPGGPAAASLATVALDAGSTLATGLLVPAGWSADLLDVTVAGATGDALLVSGAGASLALRGASTVTGGPAVGLHVTGGALATVTEGVALSSAATVIALDQGGLTVAGTAAQPVRITGTGWGALGIAIGSAGGGAVAATVDQASLAAAGGVTRFHGVLIVNGASGQAHPVMLSSSTVSLPIDGVGVTVFASPPLSGGAQVSTTIRDSTFKGGWRGIDVAGATGLVGVALVGNSVSGASDGGIAISLSFAGGNTLQVVGNTVTQNAGATCYPPSAPADCRKAGGLLLRGNAAPGSLVFERNQIFGNTNGDQVVVQSPAAWNLSASSCAVKNTFACYSGKTYLLSDGVTRVAQYGLFARGSGAGTVTADDISWDHMNPTGGVDYSISNGATVTADSDCGAAIVLCP